MTLEELEQIIAARASASPDDPSKATATPGNTSTGDPVETAAIDPQADPSHTASQMSRLPKVLTPRAIRSVVGSGATAVQRGMSPTGEAIGCSPLQDPLHTR